MNTKPDTARRALLTKARQVDNLRESVFDWMAREARARQQRDQCKAAIAVASVALEQMLAQFGGEITFNTAQLDAIANAESALAAIRELK